MVPDYLPKYHHQIPPQNSLAEEIILGGTLLNQEISQISINELTIETFSLESHQLIFRAITEIYIKERYLDPIMLINNMWELNLLEKIGGINKIIIILKQAQIFISSSYSYINIYHYISIIKDRYLRRLLIQYGYYTIQLGYCSTIQTVALVRKAENYLRNIRNAHEIKLTSDTHTSLTTILLNLRSTYPPIQLKHVKSGFRSLDKISNGFHEGDLIVIAGRPAMGKTSLSLNVAFNIIRDMHKGICIFSLEMSQEQILYKLLSIASQIPVNKLRLGHITEKEWDTVQMCSNQLAQATLHIDDTANISLNTLSAKARILKQQFSNISIIIIDYLQLIQLNNIMASNRSEELSIVTRSLKILAKELDLPIIILSQLNRSVETRLDKKPLLSDLRESGCIGPYTYLLTQTIKIRARRLWLHVKQTKRNANNTSHKLTLVPEQSLVIRTEPQQKYAIGSYSGITFVALTHNHRILHNQNWIKVDQMTHKMYDYRYTDNSKKQYTIRWRGKSIMYDLELPETKSILCNNRIVVHNSIEQDADMVLMLYRESYYQKYTEENTQITNLILAKHRNGPTGNIELKFIPQTSSFDNI
uniref:Replicative DNA helicase n=1 Tax=Yamadaella caenomyce TaxID=259029 RepID=A0A1G4NZE1_9FLOR|nr:Replication helicase subunit [Yamadaella caenomyce]SCW23879.1 Replication helicase subunit [Yamadaella caenomyce]